MKLIKSHYITNDCDIKKLQIHTTKTYYDALRIEDKTLTKNRQKKMSLLFISPICVSRRKKIFC